MKPRIGPGSLVDNARLLNDALITAEISYLDSPTDYREAVQAQRAVLTTPTSRRKQASESNRIPKRDFATWALVGLVLLMTAFTWLLR